MALGLIDSDLSIDNFHYLVNNWLAEYQHPELHKPFISLVYKPMLEVINYFQANKFQTYIVSGGGQEFIRSYAEEVYKITPNRVIGTALELKYKLKDNVVVLQRQPNLLFLNEKENKVKSINLFIGKSPVAAFGNSDGDRQMLECCWANGGLPVLIHHDDANREYAYDKDSRVGKLSKETWNEAVERSYQLVSMKNDWLTIFN